MSDLMVTTSEDGEIVDAELLPDEQPMRRVLGTVISDQSSPTFEEVRFRLHPDAAVSPGDFVSIEARRPDSAGRSWVLARVLDVHEVNPHEDPQSATVRDVLPFDSDYAHEGESTVIYRIVRTEPVEELNPDGQGDATTEVRTLPPAGAIVIRPSADQISLAMGFPADPVSGIHIGHLHNDDRVQVTLSPGAVQRHILIVGGIGSGKSYTRGVIGEELHCLGVPQVNLDVNGEMVNAAVELGGVNLTPGSGGFTLPLGSLTREDLIDAVAGVNRGTNIETLIGYSFDVLRREIQRGARSAFSVDDLVTEIETQAPNLNMQAANTLRPAQQRVRALERLSYIGPRFDWISALRPGAFVNIDCRGLLLSDLRIIAAAVARDLQDLAREKKIPFTVLSIDEFHLVAPSDDKQVSTQVLREIARIGRHYRLGLILTTQSPADVDRSILKRLLTRFVHSIEPDQLDSLRGIFADAPAEMVRGLPKLPQGTCALTGVAETVRHATIVDVRPRVTHHGGATPDVWADFRARGWSGKRSLADIATAQGTPVEQSDD